MSKSMRKVMADSNSESTTEAQKSDQEQAAAEASVTDTTKQEEDLTTSQTFKDAVQAKVEAVVGERLSREAAKVRKLQSDLEEAQKAVAGYSEEREKLSTQNAELLTKSMKLQLALEEGVDPAVIDSLKGSTLEELKASLETVRKTSGSGNTAAQLFSGKQYSEKASMAESDLAALRGVIF